MLSEVRQRNFSCYIFVFFLENFKYHYFIVLLSILFDSSSLEMGCDGGTIPRRDELVRQKKKPEQKDKNAETVAKWKHCAISQNPLHKPIVACELGKLYNKESVLEHLLNKDISNTEVAGHIKKLSDVKELNLTEKPGFEAKSHKGDEYVDFNDSRYICPVTGLEMNGRQRFYILWKCGCVLSERAVKEVKSETCHKCGKPFSEDDIIILNGSEEEIDTLHLKMIERRRLAKLEKKCESSVSSGAKKIKIEPVETSDNSSSSDHLNLSNGVDKVCKSSKTSETKVKVEQEMDSASTSKSSLKASKEANGGKYEAVKNGKTKRTDVDLPDKAKEKYSIAKDPSATEAYKSLFTSHASAKRQDKAHWVTHNPLYF